MTLLEGLSPVLIWRLDRFVRRTLAGDAEGEGREALDPHRIPEVPPSVSNASQGLSPLTD
jgi:hypothetical protein